MKIHIFLPIVCAALLAACSSEKEELAIATPETADGEYLQLTVAVNEKIAGENDTRATEKLVSTHFEDDDRVGVLVYEDGTYIGNFQYRYYKHNWLPVGGKYRCTSIDKTNTYIVYSPYNGNVTEATATVEGLKTLIGPEQSLVDGIYDQSTKDKYHACDLMTQTVTQSSELLHINATIEHEYAVVLISYLQNTFVTRNDREVRWSSGLVGDTDGDGEYTAEEGVVEVETGDNVAGTAVTKQYKPWLNLTDDGGDDHYRFIVPTTTAATDRANLTWFQEYFEEEKMYTPSFALERGKLYRSHEENKFYEKDREFKPGDIYCRDDVNGHGVILPANMFRCAKYNMGEHCTYLTPIGIIFADKNNIDPEDAELRGWNGYAMSLRWCPGNSTLIIYKWSATNQNESAYVTQIKSWGLAQMPIIAKIYNGYKDSHSLASKSTFSQTTYPALYAALHFADDYPDLAMPEKENTSDYYMCSAGQGICYAEAIGGFKMEPNEWKNGNTSVNQYLIGSNNPNKNCEMIKDNTNKRTDRINNYMDNADFARGFRYKLLSNGTGDYSTDAAYLVTITQGNANHYIQVGWGASGGTHNVYWTVQYGQKAVNQAIRPVFAFEY